MNFPSQFKTNTLLDDQFQQLFLTMQNDKFLKRKQIEIYDSQFLKQFFKNKSTLSRTAYDPMDRYGRRLNPFWEEGDTLFSVVLKRMHNNITIALDPDTYTTNTLKEVKKQCDKQKVKVVMVSFLMMIPLSIIMPLIRPKLNRVRRQFTFQYYLQAKMLSRSLQTGNIRIPKEEMQRIIRQVNQKVSM